MATANALLLLLVVAIWASVSARMSAYAMINQRRDAILTGTADKVPLALEHRRLIFERDWQPLAWGAVVPSFLFAIVVGLIPFALNDTNVPVVILCTIVAAYHALAGFFTARNVIAETRFIASQLENPSPPSEPQLGGLVDAPKYNG